VTFEGALVVLSLALVVPSIVSAMLLLREAMKPPHVGALTERAIIGLDITVMVISGTLLTVNRINGYTLFPVEGARIVFLASLILLEFVPVIWLHLFLARKLGDGGRG
jgi:hypothetical protein